MQDPKDVEEAANAATKAAIGDRESAPISEIDFRAGGAAAASRLKAAASAASQSISEDAKNRANEIARQTQEFFSSKMPPERRDKLLWRLKKMILEIQRRSDCKYPFRNIVDLDSKTACISTGRPL